MIITLDLNFDTRHFQILTSIHCSEYDTKTFFESKGNLLSRAQLKQIVGSGDLTIDFEVESID